MIVILGAGLAGLSASYHLGHERCVLLERQAHAFGHIASVQRDGFTWDEGPHVSFTRHAYVRDLFERSVRGALEEYPVRTRCFFKGAWIDHPVQSHLYQLPEALRQECLAAIEVAHAREDAPPRDYQQWSEQALGEVITREFIGPYTRKYWTVEPRELGTDWVGERVFRPSLDLVRQGARGPLPESTHYIKTVRYPSRGGYQAFARELAEGARVELGAEVVRVELDARRVHTRDGRTFDYEQLISTIPLPVLVGLCDERQDEVLAHAARLRCSGLTLVNVTAPHPTRVDGNWFYIYDESMRATRAHLVERLSPHNAPAAHTGIQVEVYHHPSQPAPDDHPALVRQVIEELACMGFLDDPCDARVDAHVMEVPWANVICDHDRVPALDAVLEWLSRYGLVREADDLHPMTDWEAAREVRPGAVVLAGRFGQWKYFWTDDCVLRGRAIAQAQAPT